MSAAADKYREAVELYDSTDMTISEICRRLGLSRSSFAAYICRSRRDLLYKRHGITDGAGLPDGILHKNKGQRPATREKYREAVEACDSMDFIEMNVSQIAREFGLDATALANQLRAHYPWIVPRREAERRRLGIADNTQRGVRRSSAEIYAPAVEMLRGSDVTIEEAAEKCDVSYTGLRQHLLFYHRDLTENRSERRREGKENPRIGRLSGNGGIRMASPDKTARFQEGVNLYRTSSLTLEQISKLTGISVGALRNHIAMWHRDLMFERRGAEMPPEGGDRPTLDGTKRYSRATAEKYADAIGKIRNTGQSVESVAREMGFTPEVLRAYLREHCPELWSRMGMTLLPDGRKVLRRCQDRYAEAIEIYRTSAESLKSIARRFDIPYNSIGGYIRRNCPEAVQDHNKLLKSGN